jgi:parallel beta-helix repeat protein
MGAYVSTLTGNEIDTALFRSKAKSVVVDLYGDGDYTSISDALANNEKNIYVKSGYYNEGRPITISKDNVTIIGEYKETTEIVFGSGYDGIKIYANYVTLCNLTLDSEENGALAALIIGDGSLASTPITSVGNHNIIDNCIIKGSNSTFALYVAGASYGQGEETLQAFEDKDLQSNNRITNCLMYSLWNGDAFSFSLQREGIISNNLFIGGRIAFYMCINSECNYNSIVNSINQGIFIASPCLYNSVIGNRIYNPASSGIKIQNQLEHTPLFTGQAAIANNINENTIYASSNSGIEVTGTSGHEPTRNNISNNIIINPDNHGIYLQDTVGNNINGNSITEPKTDATNFSRGSGLYMVQNVRENSIINNTFIDTRTHPNCSSTAIANREGTDCTGNIISNNIIKINNTERSVWFQSGNTIISNNEIIGGYYAGIYLDGACGCVVNGNICRNNTNESNNAYAEIWLKNGASNNIIYGNICQSDASNKANYDMIIEAGCTGNVASGIKGIGVYHEIGV